MTTYIDKQGRTIMEERAGYRTYYVYDNIGHLCFILPHIPSSKLSDGEYALSDSTLQRAAYCYKYDERGNVIYKRLPGCEPQYMVYDKAGHLILSQDGNQRLSHKWTLYTYDSIGRNLYTAELLSIASHEYHMSFFADRWYVEHYGNNPSNASLPGTGYASSIFPKSNLRLLTVNYYDDYDYLSRLSTPLRQALRFAQESGYSIQHNNATGMLTGTRVYNLSEDNTYTATAYYYDTKGRIVQNRSVRSSDGYKTAISTEYLFDGTIAQLLSVLGTEDNLVREHYRYDYDHAGRVKQTYYKLNNEEEILLSAFSYDSIGRLAQNLLHNKKDAIHYSYDMRNMLTEIYNKRYTEDLLYEESGFLEDFAPHAQACYNGNVAAARITQMDTTFTFDYTYDALNRLTESVQEFGDYTAPSEWFEYDSRGNITRLQRYTGPRRMDDLIFTYKPDGNQLLSVKDDGADADRYEVIEYSDLHHEVDSIDMRYDANGNLIFDADRGISVIHYNILNLPDTIQFINGNQMVNLYDAVGQKYKSIVYTNLSTTMTPYYSIAHYPLDADTIWYNITEYAGNIENHYSRTDTTQRIFNSIGYYSDGVYYHYIKDHIGNICAVVNSAADTLVQSTIYYPSGVPMAQNLGPNVTPSYYNALGLQYTENFGRDEQPYLYNGKEFIEAHGLNEYDSHARRYYAPIMRTTTIDPMAEKYYHISPYAWCGNNPVNIVDPDGRKWKTKRDLAIAQRLSTRAAKKTSRQLNRYRKLAAQKDKGGSEKKMAHLDKKMEDCAVQIQRLQNLQIYVNLLTYSETTYTFRTQYSGKKVVLERASDGTIVINNFGNKGSQAHELTHAAQYDKGQLVSDDPGATTYFRPTVEGGNLVLEVEAYQTEYSISGEVSAPSDEGDVESITDIDAEWVKGIFITDKEGNKSYPYLPATERNNPIDGVYMPWEYKPEKLGL